MNEGPINTPQAAVGTWTPEGETPPRPSEDDLIAACASVFDPEIPVNIYELGLIYTIDIDDAGAVKVEMTLTAPACPSAQELPEQVRDAAMLRGAGFKLLSATPIDQFLWSARLESVCVFSR